MEQTLLEYSKEKAKELAASIIKMREKSALFVEGKEPKGNGSFEFVATNEATDRDGEIIKIDGWSFDNFMKNPVLLWGHEHWSLPIGAVTSVEIVDGNVIAKGVFANHEFAQEVRKTYDDGFLKTVSVGFIPLERNGSIITRAELLELSIVPVPSNPEALSLQKKYDNIMRTAVKPHETPKAPEDTEWNEKDAVKRLREWATEDDVIDFVKYRSAFSWYDESKPEDLESYKLPHHDIIEEKFSLVWRGTAAAMANLLSVDNESGIPEDEKEATYKHIQEHYEQFDKTPPELKSYSQYELDKFYPEFAAKAVKSPDIYKSLLQFKRDVVAMLDAEISKLGVTDSKDVVADIEVKEGRVLSKKNRGLVKGAIDALAALYEATEPEKEHVVEAVKTSLVGLQSIDKLVEKAIVSLKDQLKTL